MIGVIIQRTADRKIPMRIKMKSNEPFAMAGLWETWISPQSEKIHTCTITTTRPNGLMSEIHDRMPAILNRENEKKWIDPSIQDTSFLQSLISSFDEDLMEAFEVYSDVNSPKNNSASLIEKIIS